MSDAAAISIEWHAPAECPDAAAIESKVERLLGQPLSRSMGRRVAARGTVERRESGTWELRASLEVGSRAEEETLVARLCSSLGDAMALKLALAIDPLAVVDSVQPQPERAPPPSHPSPALVPRPPLHRALTFAARFVGGAALGPLPSITPSAALYGALGVGRFRAELGAAAFWAGSARYDALPNIGVDLQAFSGSARGCFVAARAGRWSLPLCAGLELGLLRGTGFGVAERIRSSGAWAGLLVGPAVSFRLAANVSVGAQVDASVLLLRPEFHVRNLDSLYRPPQLGARALSGFELDF